MYYQDRLIIVAESMAMCSWCDQNAYMLDAMSSHGPFTRGASGTHTTGPPRGVGCSGWRGTPKTIFASLRCCVARSLVLSCTAPVDLSRLVEHVKLHRGAAAEVPRPGHVFLSSAIE